MAQIKVELPTPPVDGMDIKFKAPCDCTEITGLLLAYPEGTQNYTFRDCHGNNLAGIGNLFKAGAYVKVILDTKKGYAYIQNADTNTYLEKKLSMELLWENGSPSSEFGGDMISLDLSNYDGIYLVYKYGTTSSIIYTHFQLGLGTSVLLMTNAVNTTNLYARSRNINITADGVEIGACYTHKYNDTTYSESNNYMIPIEIYGIKGVTA